MLYPRASFNVYWFIDGNLVSLVEKFFPAGWSARRRKLVVQINNAPAHNSGMTQNFFGHNPLERFPHPPYSPDIPPSGFSLFRKVKSALVGREISCEIDFLEAVTEILNGISNAAFQCAFRGWAECIGRVINAGGDYLTE
jgi:histone-lysine N-methyltransferase SETMAR